MVSELAECQRANGNGYVGAVPKSRELWAGVAAGTLKVERFGLNGAWVPWYNLHKLFAGLRDAYLIGGNAQARDVLVALADWCATLVVEAVGRSGAADARRRARRHERGAGRRLRAHRRSQVPRPGAALLAPRAARAADAPRRTRSPACTPTRRSPRSIGYGRIAELGGDPAGRDAAAFFWDTVVHRRTVAFGGNSVREHFNAPEDFAPMLESREGPETCNTYNMLRLTELLFRGAAAAPSTPTTTSARSTTTSSRRSIPSTAATSTSRRSGRATIASTRSRRSASGAASAPAWRTTASTASSSTRTAATSCS